MRNMCVLILLLLFLTTICGQLLKYTVYTDSNMKTWKNAQAFCRKHHVDLVTIKDDEENQFFTGPGWIGLYRETASSPWKWSRGDEIAEFTNWDIYAFSNWDPGELMSTKNCVFRYKKTWWTDNCDDIHSFICYDGLVLVKENKTWEEALDHCRSLGGVDTASLYWNHRYDLATLITPEDLATARKSAQEATTNEVWTGMRFLAGKWLWVGGEQMQYENLPSCPTHGSCGVLEKSGTAPFSTRDCQLRRNFFCYKRP